MSKRELELKPVTGHNSLALPYRDPLSGVIAGFRQVDVAQWRSSIDIGTGKRNVFVINVGSLAVTISRQDKQARAGPVLIARHHDADRFHAQSPIHLCSA